LTTRDISIAIGEGTPEWPGDTPFSCNWTWRIARGDSVNVSEISSSPHVGTHADAPLHVRDEWPASHDLPLEPFLGRAFVLGVDPSLPFIEPAQLAALPSGPIERLLLRTGRSIAGGSFPGAWPSLSDAALGLLLSRGLRLLGVDAPSIDPRTSTALDIHKALFGAGAFNIENLDLRAVEDGEYELIAPPLKLLSADAAPLRALLRAI